MIDKNYGHVVTISGVSGIFGSFGFCDYSASKYAIVGFEESMRNDLISLDKTGVKTTIIFPHYINCGMSENTKKR